MAGNKDIFQKAMNQGHSAAWDQDWEQAAKLYAQALGEFPENPVALSSLGLAYFELQKFDLSLKCYEKAVLVAPADPVPHEKIARLYERMGKLDAAVQASNRAAEMHLKVRSVDKAIDNWSRILSLQPENINVRSRLATVYEKLGRKEEAVNEYIATASIFQHLGDLTRALKITEYAQQLMPENQEVRMALYMLRSNQMLPRAARPKGGTGPMRMANVRSATGAEVNESKATDPISEGRQRALVDLASQLFDQADENTEALQNAPTHRRDMDAITRGVAAPTGAQTDSSEHTRIVMHLGQAIDSQSQGDLPQAIVELEHATALGFNLASAFYDLGMLLRGQDNDRALRYLQQSVKHPDYALASHLLIAQIHEAGGKSAQAATSYLQALALADVQTVPAEQADELTQVYDPLIDAQNATDDAEAHKHLCQTIANQLLRPDWRATLREARRQIPPQPAGSPPVPLAEMLLEVRSTQVIEAMTKVRALAQQNKIRSAEEEALYALQYAPTYLPLHLLIGELLLQEDRTSEAVTKLLVVADLYMVRGETARAVRTLQRLAQIVPTDLNIRRKMIELQLSQGSIEEALKEYQQLGELYYALAELDKARQTYLDALRVASKAKDNRTWGVKLLLKVADIDMQRLNLRQALRIYEQIRTIQPDDAAARAQLVALNYRLGQNTAAVKEMDDYITLLEGSGKIQECIRFLETLLQEYAAKLEPHRRLADLYAKNGQVDKAVAQLDLVADALLTEGKHLEAINMIETIIALNPDNVQDYRAALAAMRRDMLRK